MSGRPEVAIVGAGMAGLRAARLLTPVADVVVFEKSRGVGGRLATRRAPPYAFDHGAQYFRVRDPEFAECVQGWVARGVVAPWRARFAEIGDAAIVARTLWTDENPHYVGVGGMNEVGKAMGEGLDIRLSTRIVGARFEQAAWRLEDETSREYGPFAALVVAIPSPQAVGLLPEGSAVRATAVALPMSACWALMLGYERDLDLPFDAAAVGGGVLSWISANHSKPGRDTPTSMVVLSSNHWADAHIDDDPDAVQAQLLHAFCEIAGSAAQEPAHRALHRWRYANCARAPANPIAFDAGLRLAVCGDWLLQGRVEAAFLAGSAAARALLPVL